MASLFDLTGRTAVVVGGTTGIGRALALGLADAGADVVATGRRPDAVNDVSASIEALGRRTLRHPADVGDLAALRGLREACLGAFDRVDVLVFAAGITKRVATLDIRLEKMFKFANRANFAFDFDIFNITNSSTILGREYNARLGTYDTVREIINPRIARIGLRFFF